MTEPNPTNVPATWTMPEDLERFQNLLVNTGGNTPEDLINRLNREPHLLQTNLPVYLLAVAVQSQVALLRRLQVEGHLRPPAGEVATPGIEMTVTNTSGVGRERGLFFPGVEAVHDVSDGHHTFGELYDHRRALTAALARHITITGGPGTAFRSLAHHPEDGPMFPGYFVVGFRTSEGQVTYHYKVQHWDEFRGVPDLDHAPRWDRHTPADTLERLTNWLT